MSKDRKVANTVADPTLPRTPVTVQGQQYNLCFDLGALAEAETAINAELARAYSEERVNLLMALPLQNLSNTRMVFAAAVRVFHPELSYQQALGLLTMGDVYDVALAIQKAFTAAQPTAESEDHPPEAGA